MGRAAVYTAHQVPAVAQERLEPVCEDVHDQLEGEQAGEEIVRGADEGVIWTVSVDLDVDDIDHEVLPSRSGIFVKRGKKILANKQTVSVATVVTCQPIDFATVLLCERKIYTG